MSLEQPPEISIADPEDPKNWPRSLHSPQMVRWISITSPSDHLSRFFGSLKLVLLISVVGPVSLSNWSCVYLRLVPRICIAGPADRCSCSFGSV